MKLGKIFFAVTLIVFLTGMTSTCIDDELTGMETEKNAKRMQDFVTDISGYTRGKKSDFIIIPQNGSELAFTGTNPDEGFLDSYVNAIDGIGIEELFYDGPLKIDNERLSMLRKIKSERSGLTIMVSDLVSDNNNIDNAIALCTKESFLAFPRNSENKDYKIIPAAKERPNENKDNITKLADAKNYLYLISDAKYETKDAMLPAIKDTNYDLVLMDLFFKENRFTAEEINNLKLKKPNGGSRLVIAYISIGSAEKYRYYWKNDWKKGNPSWIKKNYSGYGDEYWVEYWHPAWQEIVYDYLDKIIAAGFDGVYLDNVEAYYFLAN